jgi:rRNA-processing protein FCF1
LCLCIAAIKSIHREVQHTQMCVQIDLVKGMMDCLYAECKPCITDCVMAELEKLGQKYRVALKIAKDPRIRKLPCTHKGTYADDCICERVTQHRCYIVATCDKDLRRRLRKVSSCCFVVHFAGIQVVAFKVCSQESNLPLILCRFLESQ